MNSRHSLLILFLLSQLAPTASAMGFRESLSAIRDWWHSLFHTPVPVMVVDCPKDQWLKSLKNDFSRGALKATFRAAGQRMCEYDLTHGTAPQVKAGFAYVLRGQERFDKRGIDLYNKNGYQFTQGLHGNDSRKKDWAVIFFAKEKMGVYLQSNPYKEMRETTKWKGMQGSIVDVDHPTAITSQACEKEMKKIYGFIADVFPGMANHYGILDKRMAYFRMRELDFDALRFSDDLQMIRFNANTLQSFLNDEHREGVTEYRDIEDHFDRKRMIEKMATESDYPLWRYCHEFKV